MENETLKTAAGKYNVCQMDFYGREEEIWRVRFAIQEAVKDEEKKILGK